MFIAALFIIAKTWKCPSIDECMKKIRCIFSLSLSLTHTHVYCIPHRNSRILPQLEKKHVGPPSALDEALAQQCLKRSPRFRLEV